MVGQMFLKEDSWGNTFFYLWGFVCVWGAHHCCPEITPSLLSGLYKVLVIEPQFTHMQGKLAPALGHCPLKSVTWQGNWTEEEQKYQLQKNLD